MSDLLVISKSKKIIEFLEKEAFGDGGNHLNFHVFANAFNEIVFFDHTLSYEQKNYFFINNWSVEDIENDNTITDEVKQILKMMLIYSARTVLISAASAKDVRGKIYYLEDFARSRNKTTANDNKTVKIEITGVEKVDEPA